jgi:hypothetical protein
MLANDEPKFAGLARRSPRPDGCESSGQGDRSAMTTQTLEPTGLPGTGRDWRRLVLVQLALLLIVAFVWLVWQLVVPISHTVVLFLLGIAFAFVLSDPASYLAQRVGGRR